jgi:multicomponent Na+:H+ antiporter subunit G
MNEIVGVVFIIIGIIFDIAGCIGLIRLPDVYNRIQATTKSITLGTCSILLGAFIIKGFTSIGVKSVLCIMLLLFTAPAAAHALSRAADISEIKAWEKKDALP